MDDTISRQAAIDIERNATVDTNPSHFEAHQKFKQFMDDAEISSFGRWEWSNGFNTALTAVGIDLKKLPSAQPEPHWIPVSERLPKSNGVYIVTRTIEDGFTSADIVDACYFDGSNTWHDDTRVNHGRKYLNCIIAWMPLPEPYRGGERDD